MHWKSVHHESMHIVHNTIPIILGQPSTIPHQVHVVHQLIQSTCHVGQLPVCIPLVTGQTSLHWTIKPDSARDRVDFDEPADLEQVMAVFREKDKANRILD